MVQQGKCDQTTAQAYPWSGMEVQKAADLRNLVLKLPTLPSLGPIDRRIWAVNIFAAV